MHEHKIVDDIVKKAKEQNAKKIKVLVGELSGLTVEEVKKLMEVKIDCEVEEEESFVKCDCGYEGRAKITVKEHDFVLFECPECGRVPQQILKGEDVILKEICA